MISVEAHATQFSDGEDNKNNKYLVGDCWLLAERDVCRVYGHNARGVVRTVPLTWKIS